MLAALSVLFLAASTALAANITVTVGGNGQRTFEPAEVRAQIGDIINFNFVSGNHTATQSTFDQPCVPSGFRSGFKPANATSPQISSIMINTTNSTWLYCAQGNHCQGGMVMVINPPANSNRTLAAYRALAANFVAPGAAPSGSAGAPGPYGAPSSGVAPAPGSSSGPSGGGAASGGLISGSAGAPSSTASAGAIPSSGAMLSVGAAASPILLVAGALVGLVL